MNAATSSTGSSNTTATQAPTSSLSVAPVAQTDVVVSSTVTGSAYATNRYVKSTLKAREMLRHNLILDSVLLLLH